MSDIKRSVPEVSAQVRAELSMWIKLTEEQARFLDALFGYGGEKLITAVKEKLGKVHISEFDRTGQRLVDDLRSPIAAALARFERARRALEGVEE